METLHFQRPAQASKVQPSLVGHVGSGDLEVMIEPSDSEFADIYIQTSTAGSEVRWQQIIDQITPVISLPAMRMDIHDFAATPGVIRLRIEQALEHAMSIGGDYHE